MGYSLLFWFTVWKVMNYLNYQDFGQNQCYAWYYIY